MKIHRIPPALLLFFTLTGCELERNDTPKTTEETMTTQPSALSTATPMSSRPESTPINEHLVTVHYHRFDDAYDGVTLWTWDPQQKNTPKANEFEPAGRDEFGVFFQFDPREYGIEKDGRIGMLTRFGKDWNRKDGSDKFWSPEMGRSVWIVGTQNTVNTTQPDISPRILHAFIDSLNHITLFLNRLVTAKDLPSEALSIVGLTREMIVIKSAAPGAKFHGGDSSFQVEIETLTALNLRQGGLRVGLRGFGEPVEVTPRGILDDPNLFFDGDAQLGATWTPAGTTFRLFAPTASKVNVLLFDTASGPAGRTEHPMQQGEKGIWQLALPAQLEGKFYAYQLEGPELDPRREVLDPMATNAVQSSTRARITRLENTNPAGWERLRNGPRIASPVDAVIYEMHVRDFTMSPSSGAVQKGKYLGFAEGGLRLPTDPRVKTGIDHLVELGVTHVQLLPVQDFDNNEAANQYNWGYITSAFNSPEGLFASRIDDASRIAELKTLVAALHERGIGVILDVVYNHTAESAPFNAVVPGYYFRRLPDGSYSNGSGCGNEFRTEAPMVRKFVIDSLVYWVREFGVDGYRFDLMALLDIETMKEAEKALRAIKPDILLYGEPWMAASTTLKNPMDKQGIRGTRIGAFNDGFRNALKGSPDGGEPGWIQNHSQVGNVRQGLQGTWYDWAESPEHSINYMTCHDNLVLIDKLRISMPGAPEETLLRTMKLGYLALFTAQGVPFIHGGEEFARTKKGNHNSYEAPDDINQVDWSLKVQHAAVNEFVRDLIAMRKQHPVFRLRTKEEVAKRFALVPSPGDSTILFTLDGNGLRGENWDFVCVAMNASDSAVEIELPHGSWNVAVDETGTVPSRPARGKETLPPKSGMVFFRR